METPLQAEVFTIEIGNVQRKKTIELPPSFVPKLTPSIKKLHEITSFKVKSEE